MNDPEDQQILEQLMEIQSMLNAVVEQLGGDVIDDMEEGPEVEPQPQKRSSLLASFRK